MLYNQFLGTAMQAMGLTPGEYEVEPGGGVGLLFEETAERWAGFGKYPSSVLQARGDLLPYLVA